MSYTALDAYGSVITVDSSIISGVVQRPIVNIGNSVLATFTGSPSISGAVTVVGNPSISGTVGASAIGTFPVTQAGPWSASLVGVIPGSVVAYQGGAWSASLVGTIPGSVVSFQGGAWSTSVMTNVITSIATAGQVMGSVAALQGTSPWNIAGSVATQITNSTNASIITVNSGSSIIAINAGSVVAISQGSVITVWQSPSIVGTYQEDSAHTSGDRGIFVMGVRNDTISSFTGSNGEYNPFAHDSAGRVLNKPFAAEEARVEGYASTVNVSVTTLVAAAGAGLRNYITDLWFANTGAAATLVTLRSGGGTSVLGYTIVPAGGGSNLPGLQMPIRTLANETFDFQATTGTSVLFATVKGFKGP